MKIWQSFFKPFLWRRSQRIPAPPSRGTPEGLRRCEWRQGGSAGGGRTGSRRCRITICSEGTKRNYETSKYSSTLRREFFWVNGTFISLLLRTSFWPKTPLNELFDPQTFSVPFLWLTILLVKLDLRDPTSTTLGKRKELNGHFPKKRGANIEG